MAQLRLPNPVPVEMVNQLVRHLKRIQPELGFTYGFSEVTVGPIPKSFENANVSAAKSSYVNVAVDISECLDSQPDLRTNGITNYRTTVFLNAYLFANQTPVLAAGLLQADLHRYFFNKPETPNYSPAISPSDACNWTLYTPNYQAVVHELYIARLNTTATYEKKPIVQVDVELTIWWAALNSDLNYPR